MTDPARQRAELASGAAMLAGSVAYQVSSVARVGLFYYLPTQHRWSLEAPSGVIAMDWFARGGWTLLWGALAAGVGWALAPRVSERVASGALTLGLTATGWAMATVLLGLIPK